MIGLKRGQSLGPMDLDRNMWTREAENSSLELGVGSGKSKPNMGRRR